MGGDYYDFVPLSDDRMAVAWGTSGQGCRRGPDDGQVLGRHPVLHPRPGSTARPRQPAQRPLYEAGLEERFITLCLGALDPEGVASSAPPAAYPFLVRRAFGPVEEFGQGISGFPLGIMPASTYPQTTFDLAPGDVVELFSDGVTDPRNKQASSTTPA